MMIRLDDKKKEAWWLWGWNGGYPSWTPDPSLALEFKGETVARMAVNEISKNYPFWPCVCVTDDGQLIQAGDSL